MQDHQALFEIYILILHLFSMASFQGIVVMDHSSYYGSRSTMDQHRDMRLDIDNMSYEVHEIFLCLHFSPPSSVFFISFC